MRSSPQSGPLDARGDTLPAHATDRRISLPSTPSARRRVCQNSVVKLRTASAVLCILALLCAGCSDTKDHSIGDSVAVVREGDDNAILASTELPCSGASATPPSDFTVLFDAVALPTSDSYPNALQTSLSGTSGQTRLFAKTGLWYKPSQSLEISVPTELHDELSIGWASPPDPSWRVATPVCSGFLADQWIAVPGGYWVERPICAAVLIRVGERERTVTIGLGRACPGQAPPAGPSDQ